jgi:hypothetical protein
VSGAGGVNVGDIEALAQFRAHLIEFNRELAESLARMRGHWHELGHVWRDDMYQRFGDALAEVTPGVDRYVAATEGHEAYLAGLIESLLEVRRRGGR